MTQAVNRLELEFEYMIHNCAHTEIHKYLHQLLSLLEQRREVCKAYCESKNEEHRKVIEYLNEKIKIVLGIPKELSS